jgi:sugar phosphate permease
LYAAATEGISKAWISNIADKKDTATAIGTFAGFQSICTMLASSLAGLIWFQFGAGATFIVTGIATVLITIYFVIAIPMPANKLPMKSK